MKRMCLTNHITKIFSILVFMFVWQISSSIANPLFIPPPKLVLEGLIGLINANQLLISIWYSFKRITVATVISGCLAIPIGVLMCSSSAVSNVLSPFTGAIRFIPITAFYPLLTMWFGIGEEMKIAFLFVATFTYMLPSVILSLQETPKDVIEAARTMGANEFQIMTKICLPISAPSITQTFLMMYGIGWTYIATCEQTNAKYGLGYIIHTSSLRGRTYMVFAAIFVIVLISFLFDYIGKKVVHHAFNWKFD